MINKQDGKGEIEPMNNGVNTWRYTNELIEGTHISITVLSPDKY